MSEQNNLEMFHFEWPIHGEIELFCTGCGEWSAPPELLGESASLYALVRAAWSHASVCDGRPMATGDQ